MGYAQQAIDKMKKPPRVLPGVKIPKYNRAAARPSSADVVAVNVSHGSEIVADHLLEDYTKLAMRFVARREAEAGADATPGTPIPFVSFSEAGSGSTADIMQEMASPAFGSPQSSQAGRTIAPMQPLVEPLRAPTPGDVQIDRSVAPARQRRPTARYSPSNYP